MTIEVGLDDRGRWPSSVGRADQGRPLREKRVSPRRPLRESVPVLVGRKCVGLPCLHFLRLWTNCAARRRGWIRPGAWRLTHSGNPRNIPPRASQRRLFCAVQARGKRKGKESCLQLTSWLSIFQLLFRASLQNASHFVGVAYPPNRFSTIFVHSCEHGSQICLKICLALNRNIFQKGIIVI